nr:14848_t:CDS:2 [Entrophospora candida]
MMEYVFVDDLHRYKRLKVTRACESCRRRKVKCDGGSGGSQIPCTSCRKLKIECVFSNMAMRRAAPKTELEQMNERLQRSESLLQKLDEDDITKQKRVKNVDYIDSLTDILGHMKIENNGRANYIYAMEGKTPKEDSFPTIANTTIPFQTTLFVLSEPPLLSCHQIPDLSNDDNNFSDLVSHLVDLYFNHVHPYLPIIHKANFLRRLHDKTNPISPLLLYAVFAMGSRFSDDVRVRLDPMKPETAGFSYFNRAKELLDDFLDAPRLSTIQAQLLMMKFQENTQKPGFFFRSWLSFGSIIRMAEELGLNKNYDEWNLRLSVEDAIVRKRVWQACFLFDQFMSGAQGRNAIVSLSNADIELPRKEHYDDEQEFQLQTDFIHLVRLTKILASVMSFISPAGSGYHLIICTNAANNASQLASVMLERWSPQVFQYTLRGGNYGVYCLVASSMIHLVNMSSPDLRFSKPAHDNLLRTLNVLKICVDHSSARELRDKVHGLEVAFSAQQSLGLIKQPLSPSTTYPSSQLKNRLSSINSDIIISQHLSNSLCDGDNSNINFTYFNETYNTILSCNNNNCNGNSTSSPSSLDPTSTNYWDTDHFLIWNQLSNGRHHQHHQLPPPEYCSSSPCNSPPTTIVEPVIVASQNNEDLIPISFSI